MSHTLIEHIDLIRNKKVLFIDVETTGLVKDGGFDVKQEDKFPIYTSEEYDNARLVQISWLYMEDFDYDYEIGIENICDLIVKPNGYKIENEKFHGITNGKALKEGKDIKKIVKNIKNEIMDCEYIIGYNVYYDINVLLSELNRIKNDEIINKILNMEKYKILCIGELSSEYAKPNLWLKNKKYQIPKQTDVYYKLFNKKIENAHNAKYDVNAMIEILYHIYKNEYIELDDICNIIKDNMNFLNKDTLKLYEAKFKILKMKKNSFRDEYKVLNKLIENELKIQKDKCVYDINKYILDGGYYYENTNLKILKYLNDVNDIMAQNDVLICDEEILSDNSITMCFDDETDGEYKIIDNHAIYDKTYYLLKKNKHYIPKKTEEINSEKIDELKIIGYNLFYYGLETDQTKQIEYINENDYDILFLSECISTIENKFDKYIGYKTKSHCGYTYLGINKKLKGKIIKIMEIYGIIICEVEINNKSIVLISLHMIPFEKNKKSRKEQMAKIQEILEKNNLLEIPIIMGGDTNMRDGENTIIDEYGFKDVYLNDKTSKKYTTYPNEKFKSDKLMFVPKNNFRYDRFFIKGIVYKDYDVIENENSDHLAIKLTVSLPSDE
jgi:hypothetical protein